MNRKSEKILAIFLSCVFLLVSVAVEFSHHHEDAVSHEATLQRDQSDFHGRKTGESHSLNCVVCLFGLTHLAPSFATQTLKTYQESQFAILDDAAFFSAPQQTPYYLRAPPAISA